MRIGIFNLLTIVFVVLKLTETITWSWWWVFSPTLFVIGWNIFWGVVVTGILFLMGALIGFIALISETRTR